MDAAATVSADRRKVALTLVNRNPDQPETAEIVLRVHVFGGAAEIRTLTAERDPGSRVLPDVAGARLAEGSETAHGPALTVTLPAQSFTVVQAATTSP